MEDLGFLEPQYRQLTDRMLETELLSERNGQPVLTYDDPRSGTETHQVLLSFDDVVERIRRSIDNPTNALQMYGEDTTLKIIPFGLAIKRLCALVDKATREMKSVLHPTWDRSILLETAMPCTGISLAGNYADPSCIHYRLSASSESATKETILRNNPEHAILYALSDGTVEIPRDHFGTGEGGKITGTHADGSDRHVWTSGKSPAQCRTLSIESGEIGGLPESAITDLMMQIRYNRGAVPCVIDKRANEAAGKAQYRPTMNAGELAMHMTQVEDMGPSPAGCMELLTSATDASGQWTGLIWWTRQMSRFQLNETGTHTEPGEYDRMIGVRPMVVV